MTRVLFYTKNKCQQCDEIDALLTVLQTEYQFKIERRDIYTNDEWLERYHLTIPVVEVNGESLNSNEITYETLEQLLKKQNKI